MAGSKLLYGFKPHVRFFQFFSSPFHIAKLNKSFGKFQLKP
jgi:hypothetical protein